MKAVKGIYSGIYRDVKAIELNDLLTKFMGKLEETCIEYEEELMNITLIVYVGYEETEIAESSSFLTSKTSPRFRKQSKYKYWLAKHVKPYILDGECRRNYIAEREGVAPQTITNRMKQVFGQETNWQTYVLKVQNGEY